MANVRCLSTPTQQDAAVLALDEATANVDRETDALIQQACLGSWGFGLVALHDCNCSFGGSALPRTPGAQTAYAPPSLSSCRSRCASARGAALAAGGAARWSSSRIVSVSGEPVGRGDVEVCVASAAMSRRDSQPASRLTLCRLPRFPTPDTIMDCDQLLVLAGGRLVEQGAPQALAASGGMFSRLVSAAHAGGGH